MKKLNNLKLIIFFIFLTIVLTIVVVYVWERLLMAPLYTYVGASLPAGDAEREQWRLAQRIEHFFISIIVDTIVVSLLLLVVNREQRKLRASDERYRAVFEQASDGIAAVTVATHQVVDANERFAQILDYDARNVVGMHVCELFYSDENGAARGWPLQMSRCSATSEDSISGPAHSGPSELTLETPTGKKLPVSANYSLLATGKEKLFILNIHDLSEQKRLEKEKEEMQARLAQSERINALGRMAAQVAHEVKNPLAGLRLYSLHLKSKVTDRIDDKDLSLIDKIIGGINHLSDTVDKVLNFARPLTLTRNRADLNQVCLEAVRLMEAQMAVNRVELRLDLCEYPLFALLDEASIRATLINLMVNAIQAMPDGGSLTVTSRADGDTIHLTIGDTGVGMSSDQVKHVFEPFYTTKSQGLGLGMSYAWKVIQQHGGSVFIESQAGQGTKVNITFPLEK